MIRAAKINIYLKLMKSRGIGPQQVLAGTQIEPATLGNPEGLVAREAYYAVIMNVIRLSKDPSIALSLGDVVEISTFGILGYAMLSSTTLGQVIRIRRQCQNDLFGTMARIDEVKGDAKGFEIGVSSTCLTETLRRFETEEFLAEGMQLMKIMTGVDPVINSISFAYAKPSYAAAYKRFFQCPIDFGAARTVFRVREPGFDTPVPSGNAELHSVCAQHCQRVMRSLPDSGQFRDRLRELFLANPGALPDLHLAAHKLGLSERNLRRKLEADGLGFQGLKDEFRLDLSRQLLISGRLAPKEVAHLLGYATPSAYSRAFKSWTGHTIKQAMRLSTAVASRGRS